MEAQAGKQGFSGLGFATFCDFLCASMIIPKQSVKRSAAEDLGSNSRPVIY